MATFGETTWATLTGNAAVVALAGKRVFPNVLPQDCVKPAIRYVVVDDVPLNTLPGPVSRVRARVQIDAYAKKYLEAHALATAIEGAVGGLTGPAVTAVRLSKRDGYEDETELHRVSLDFSMSMEVTG